MSYILDALKKAEAERKLGSVPGLHSQPVDFAANSEARTPWRNSWLWAALGITLLLLAAAAWYFLASKPAVAPPAPAMVQAPPVAPVAAAAVPPTPAERPIPLPPEPAVNDTPKPREKEDAPPPKAKKKAARVEKEKKAEEPVVKPAPPPMSSSDFLAVNDMPPQDAPSLTIGGYIYSAKPADRSVLINQRLVREGELVSPDLRIEEIARQGVIFSYRGQRFRKSY